MLRPIRSTLVEAQEVGGVALRVSTQSQYKRGVSLNMDDEIATCLLGDKLYGDDFTDEEIRGWFVDEAEGYANLLANKKRSYLYDYHQLNRHHAFRFIQMRYFKHALGIGSAYGDEFAPIADNINRISILDPSDAFAGIKEILGTPCEYKKPSYTGDIPFEDNEFDLVTSLGVMHHIPNVSHVISECYRCLEKGGIMLLREPIVSMGDWRKPRPGLTKRERGIPLKIMKEIVENAGFKIMRSSLCIFPIVPKLANKAGISAYNNAALTRTDALLSYAFSWNLKYHRRRYYEKVAPSSVYFLLEK